MVYASFEHFARVLVHFPSYHINQPVWARIMFCASNELLWDRVFFLTLFNHIWPVLMTTVMLSTNVLGALSGPLRRQNLVHFLSLASQDKQRENRPNKQCDF